MVATAECHFSSGRDNRNVYGGHCRMMFWQWPTHTLFWPLPKRHSAMAAETFTHLLNLFLPNMEVFLHLNIVPGVSIHI